MGITNTDLRTSVSKIYANALEKSPVAGHAPQRSSTRILDDESASLAVPPESLRPEAILALQDTPVDFGATAESVGQLLADLTVDAPQDLPADFCATVDAAHRVLVDLKPDEARCDLYSILALILRSANEHRSAQREIRHAGFEAQEIIQRNSAQRIRDSADKKFWGNVAVGAGQIVGGAVSITGGAMSVRAGEKAASALAESKLGSKENNQVLVNSLKASAEAWEISSKNWAAATPGASQVPGAIGGLTNAYLEKNAAEFDAQRAELDATARKQEQVTQEVNEHMQQQLEVMRDVLEKLRSLEQSRSEINRGISRSL